MGLIITNNLKYILLLGFISDFKIPLIISVGMNANMNLRYRKIYLLYYKLIKFKLGFTFIKNYLF